MKSPPPAEEKDGCDRIKKPQSKERKTSQTEAREDDRIYGQKRHNHAQRARDVKQRSIKTDRTRPGYCRKVLERVPEADKAVRRAGSGCKVHPGKPADGTQI